ncbi:MAG: hypothetical protein EOO43_24200, partial [Flavobacterium sp.]
MEEDLSYKHYTPSKIEFIPKKNDKYYFNLASYKFSGDSKNSNQSRKYKSVLMSEIKKNAQKVSGFLKNSEQINNLISTQIYSESIPDPYIKTRRNSRRSSSSSLLKIKDIIIPHVEELQKDSLLIKSKNSKRLSKIKDSIRTEQQSYTESMGIDTSNSKLYILPALALTNNPTPRNETDHMSDSMKEEIPSIPSDELPIIKSTFRNNISRIKVTVNPVQKTEESIQKDNKFNMVNYTINEYLRKVSARPKENSIEKFVKAVRHYEKEHSINSMTLSTNRLEKAFSHKNLHLDPNTARASIDERIHSLHTDRASYLLRKGRINSKSTEKLILPKINNASSNITLPTIGEGSQSLRIKSVFRPPPPV